MSIEGKAHTEHSQDSRSSPVLFPCSAFYSSCHLANIPFAPNLEPSFQQS